MKYLFWPLLLAFLLSCGENGTDESGMFSEDRASAPPPLEEGDIVTFAILKREVLDPWNCTSCHQAGYTGDGPTTGPKWGSTPEDFEEGVNSRIHASRDHRRSPLFTRSSTNMPPGSHVNRAGLDYIRRYIEDLATE